MNKTNKIFLKKHKNHCYKNYINSQQKNANKQNILYQIKKKVKNYYKKE